MVDPATAEVIRGAMETICFEMATHVSLTATTPILNQSNERNATILDQQGRLAALSVGIPQFMLSSTLPVRFALEFFGADGLRDGDILLSNDPYHGGGHLPDYNVYAPLVVDGELLLFASIQCHHADTGGGMPGGYNVEAIDVWAEGVRFPAVKLVDQGKERDDVIYMVQTNNRTPTFIGDLRAQLSAAQLGIDRLKEVVAQHGKSAVKAAVNHSIDYAAERFRQEVSLWPDGQYEGNSWVDHDPQGNPDIHVHCLVTIAGDRLTIDFTGTDSRDELTAWSSYGNTRGYVVAQLASMMDPAIPKNEGFFDAIDLIVPKGCVLNPPEGKTVAAGTHHPGVEVAEAICDALATLLPDRASAQIYKTGMPTILYGTHPRTGKLFIDSSADARATCCGAIKGMDGWGSMPASFGNLIRATAEINESIFPTRLECCDYQIDSGGPGQWRGCPGTRVVKSVTAPVRVYTYMTGSRYPMFGMAGGMNGSGNQLTVCYGTDHAEIVKHTAKFIPHAAGERFEYLNGGGGGWGDPLERDPQLVLEDVYDEYVSREAAERNYGVVFDGRLEDCDLAVNTHKTRQLRENIRRSVSNNGQRKGDKAGTEDLITKGQE